MIEGRSFQSGEGSGFKNKMKEVLMGPDIDDQVDTVSSRHDPENLQRELARNERNKDASQEDERIAEMKKSFDRMNEGKDPAQVRAMLEQTNSFNVNPLMLKAFEQWEAEQKVDELAVSMEDRPEDQDAEVIPFPQSEVEGDKEDVA